MTLPKSFATWLLDKLDEGDPVCNNAGAEWFVKHLDCHPNDFEIRVADLQHNLSAADLNRLEKLYRTYREEYIPRFMEQEHFGENQYATSIV